MVSTRHVHTWYLVLGTCTSALEAQSGKYRDTEIWCYGLTSPQVLYDYQEGVLSWSMYVCMYGSEHQIVGGVYVGTRLDGCIVQISALR